MGDNKKVANGVVALSSAAVLAIYGTGYARTRAAADRFAQQASERRPHIPAARGEREALALDLTTPSPTPATVLADDTPTADAPIQPAEPGTAVAELTVEPIAPKRDAAKTPGAAATEAAAETATNASRDDESPSAAPVSGGTRSVQPTPETVQSEAPAVPAPAPVPAPAAPAAPAPTPDTAKGLYKDGTYYGWGTSRHGDIQAAVVIESGRITVARVEKCLTRYSCSWITPIPPRVLAKQATTYDYVSGATESSDAFQDAVSEALSQAK